MPRVYVVNALRPRGGSYMAYHVGLLLQQQFGYDLIGAETQEHPPSDQFTYEVKPKLMPLAKVEREMTADDLLVVNPAFSPLMLGLRLPGRKICYVQDFRTFQILDGHFDLYVSVSSTVRKFLRGVYD